MSEEVKEIVTDLLTLIYAYQGIMAQLGIQWPEQSPSVERAEAWLEMTNEVLDAKEERHP